MTTAFCGEPLVLPRARALWVTLTSGQDGKIDFAADTWLGQEPSEFTSVPVEKRVSVVEKMQMDAIRQSMQRGGAWDVILANGTQAVVNAKHIVVAWFKGPPSLDPVNQQ